jgi:hypothetical protein
MLHLKAIKHIKTTTIDLKLLPVAGLSIGPSVCLKSRSKEFSLSQRGTVNMNIDPDPVAKFT